MDQQQGLTTSQVNKAGKVLRAWTRGELTDPAAAERALGILLRFRAAHQYPLIKANMGLRSMVRTEGCEVEVSQRLKRVPTILDKLQREPTMQLANMQDIGGCRSVLSSIDEVRRVQRRLSKNRPPLRVNDYIGAPRSSGYRGVHVIVQYDGRTIEVQLRTRVMHDWAVTVERLSGRLRADLKGGAGPQQVLDLLEAISEAMALEETGKMVDSSLVRRMNALRQAAVPYLRRGPR
jgi:ppGpp synthetase/RelA/SpoT-type nucleotidyltranferase